MSIAAVVVLVWCLTGLAILLVTAPRAFAWVVADALDIVLWPLIFWRLIRGQAHSVRNFYRCDGDNCQHAGNQS